MERKICPKCGGGKDRRSTYCSACRKYHRLNKGSDWYVEKGPGYVVKYIDGVRVRKHRHVMEEHLGRKLKSYEHVHHIDGNRGNNKIENLELCSSNLHGKIHSKARDMKSISNDGIKKQWGHTTGKLTAMQCHRIKEYSYAGTNRDELSKIFGVSTRTISLARHGKHSSQINKGGHNAII